MATQPAPSRQYVAVKYRPGDKREYTYHNDGEPVAIGDKVKVTLPRGEGWQAVDVVGLPTEVPKFATKAIDGKHVESEPEPADADVDDLIQF